MGRVDRETRDRWRASEPRLERTASCWKVTWPAEKELKECRRAVIAKIHPHWHKLVAKCLKSILHMTIRFSFTFHPGCCVTPHSGPPSCLSYSVTASNREITLSSASTDHGSIWEFEGHIIMQHLNYCALSNLLLHSLHLWLPVLPQLFRVCTKTHLNTTPLWCHSGYHDLQEVFLPTVKHFFPDSLKK